jgi:tetratricopeptide (TPR) repeat protein
VKAADAASRWRRTLVAASVALEMAHLLRDQPYERAGRYLVWASLLMRKNAAATRSATERLWYLASMAGMEELDSPWVLVTGSRTGIARALGPGGHLAVALQRFPDESRFQLARVASEWRLARSDLVPSYLAFARAHATTFIPEDGSWEAIARNEALGTLARLAQVPDVKKDFEALGQSEAIGADVELYVGYLESVAMNWLSALDHLRRVPALTREPYLLYLSHYFTGRTHQHMNERLAAMDAFERAVQVVPNGRSAATQLAVELLLSGRASDRDRAYALLEGAHSEFAPDDPWRLFFRGDARLWPSYMAQLRQALR